MLCHRRYKFRLESTDDASRCAQVQDLLRWGRDADVLIAFGGYGARKHCPNSNNRWREYANRHIQHPPSLKQPGTVPAGLRTSNPPAVARHSTTQPTTMGAQPALSAQDYMGCGTNADTPPQEVVDLAKALNGAGSNGYSKIFNWVHNNIDLEPAVESQKGAYGTYLDRSGSSFDQAMLLFQMLKAAGYSNVQFAIGTVTPTSNMFGLSSLPNALVVDAGGSTNGSTQTMPYAWVQLSLDGGQTWNSLDPANKANLYTIFGGANFSSLFGTGVTSMTTSSAITANLSGSAEAVYTGKNASVQNYESEHSFVGGAVLNGSFRTSVFGTIGTNATTYTTMPVNGYNVRTGFALGPVGNPPSYTTAYLCLDQLYGHDVSYKNNGLYVDNVEIVQGLPSPVAVTVWHPEGAGSKAWGQAATETPIAAVNAVFAFGIGRVGQFRATHDADVLSRVSAFTNTTGSDQAMLSAASSQISQTSRTNAMLDQLAGTYTILHHVVQVVRANNTIDTPMTTTSVEEVNSSPPSGLQVSPSAVAYALSAFQSAQEAMALGQAGASQAVSAAGLLGTIAQASGVQFESHSNPAPVDSNYSQSQISVLESYLGQGYDLVIPTTAPGASAPLGFMAMNSGAGGTSGGTSAFVLATASGVYKGAADLNPADAIGNGNTGGTAAEAGPASSGLNINPSSGEVTYATPLISVGSAAPYKLEFDLLYSSRADAQPTISNQTPTARPEASGFANNFDIKATQTSDGFSLLGSDLAGGSIAGIDAAYNLLKAGNAIAAYYNSSSSSLPTSAAYATAVIANWATAQGSNNVVTVQQGLTNTTFVKMPDGAFHTPEPSGLTLTGAAGSFLMKTSQGTTYAFSRTDGQVSSITTPTGVVQTFTYKDNYYTAGLNNTPVSYLDTVSLGTHTLTFTYSQPAYQLWVLNYVTDENGRKVTLVYGNCYGSVSPATPLPQLCAGLKPDFNTSSNSWPVIFNYGWLNTASLGQTVLMTGVNVINSAQSAYNKTMLTYDGARVTPTSLQNGNGHSTSYYIAPGRSELLDAVGNDSYSASYAEPSLGDLVVTDSFDPLGNKTEQQYNYAGQLLTSITPDAQNNPQTTFATTYTYDAHGNTSTTTVGPAGTNQAIVTTTQWDQTWNKPIVVTDANGNATTYSYSSSNGLLQSITYPPVSYAGNQAQPTSTFTYYSNGQLETAIAPDGEETFYAYDSSKNLGQVVVDAGSAQHLSLTTNLGYDPVGDLTSVQNARGYTATMGYDLARRVLTTVTPKVAASNAQFTTTNTYDTAGRLQQTSQDATSASPPTELLTKYTYDGVGHVLTKTLPTTGTMDHTTTYGYDADERLGTTTVPISSSASQVTTDSYDADSHLYQVLVNGVVTETHVYNGDGLPCAVGDGSATLTNICPTSGTTHAVVYSYDQFDRLTETTYADGTYEQLSLDKNGNTTNSLNRGGLAVSAVYDALNRVTSKTVQSFSSPFTYTYDLAGRPLSVTESDGTFSYKYDTAGRQARTTRPDGKVIGYGYDADGNTSTITYPDQYVYTYGYDELDRMQTVAELAPKATTSKNLATYTYTPLSSLNTTTYGNGTTSVFNYDSWNAVTSITHTLASTSSLPGVTYTYTRDFLERRTGDSISAGTLAHPAAAGTTTYSAGTSGLNQYAAINGLNLGYDSNGNLKSDASAPLGSATYQFDQLNRMTSASNSQHTAAYSYDAFSRRVSKTVDSATTVLVSDGNKVIAAYSSTGVEAQHYVYGVGHAPIVRELFNGGATASATQYTYADALGSVTLLADTRGYLVSSLSYSPFGESAAPTDGFTFRFAGMQLDPETLLYYDKARYYSPVQGRFISPDPSGVKGGANIYAYTGDDPLNTTDLTGLSGSSIRAFLAEQGGCICGDYQAFYRPITGSIPGEDFGGPTSYTDADGNFLGFSTPQDTATTLYFNADSTTSSGASSSVSSPSTVSNQLSSSSTASGQGASGTSSGEGQPVEVSGNVSPGSSFSDQVSCSGACETIIVTAPSQVAQADIDVAPLPPAWTDIPIPWDDPSRLPGPGWEWRGNGTPGTKGNYVKPSTGEKLNNDMNHGDPIGPHWDYQDPSGNGWRVFPDGSVGPKVFIPGYSIEPPHA